MMICLEDLKEMMVAPLLFFHRFLHAVCPGGISGPQEHLKYTYSFFLAFLNP